MNSPPSIDESRRRLAAAEAELIGALARGGTPEGFDPHRVRASAIALARKRTRSAERAWPTLAASLEGQFEARFAAYALKNPLPSGQGALYDGIRFAEKIDRERRLRDRARLEVMGVRLRHRVGLSGLRKRRLPSAIAGILRSESAAFLGFRLPGLGEWWLRLPLPFLPRGRPRQSY